MTLPIPETQPTTRTETRGRFLTRTAVVATLLALSACSAPEDEAESELQAGGTASTSAAPVASSNGANEVAPSVPVAAGSGSVQPDPNGTTNAPSPGVVTPVPTSTLPSVGPTASATASGTTVFPTTGTGGTPLTMATDRPMGGMGNAGGAGPVASGGSTTSVGGQTDDGGFAGDPQVPGGGSTSMPNGGRGGADEGPVDQPDLTCTLQGAATANTPTVYVVGDSTASNYASDLHPRTGWGQVLQQSFTTACVTVDNRALSGRSSKSFFDEGAWTPIEAALGAGDFVLIQFGHNDEKTDDAARGTDPDTTFKQYLSIYIDDALAKGATPILLTPINRNNWDGTTLRDTHGEYPRAMRELAAARSVSLVDATALTKAHFERIGPAATNEYFMNLSAGQFPNYPDGNEDNTHLREGGATVIAQIVLADLYAQRVGPGTLAQSVPVAP